MNIIYLLIIGAIAYWALFMGGKDQIFSWFDQVKGMITGGGSSGGNGGNAIGSDVTTPQLGKIHAGTDYVDVPGIMHLDLHGQTVTPVYGLPGASISNQGNNTYSHKNINTSSGPVNQVSNNVQRRTINGVTTSNIGRISYN